MFRNILVCVDGSAEAETALAQAIDLADCQRSRLTILTAVGRPPAWVSTPMTAATVEPMSAQMAHEAKRTLCEAVDRVPDCIPVTKILSEEPFRDALVGELRRCEYDLLVIGARARGALAASLHGGACRYALRHCQVPVLVVRGETESAPEVRAAEETSTVVA